MDNTIKITMQNSDTTLPKGKRDVLEFPSQFLVPCTVKENADDFEIEYDTTSLTLCNDIKELSLQDKYRLLHNCATLEQLTAEFSFALSPNNIYVDVNLLPKLLKRDVVVNGKTNFLAQYKALIATVLAPKYSFEDYYDGGTDLYRKTKRLKDICNQENVDAVSGKLMEKFREEEVTTNEKKTIVDKGCFQFYRIAVPILTILTVGCIALAIYLNYYKLPLKEQLICGNNAYLSNNYLSVQDELYDIAVAKLPYESKYILARSYVVSESLNSSQKENILEMLTLQTDKIYFEYWIELGRLNFEKAIDDAQRIGDNQLLMLAYMKYEAFLKTDTSTMTGDEKTQKIDDLKNKIESLSKELEKIIE